MIKDCNTCCHNLKTRLVCTELIQKIEVPVIDCEYFRGDYDWEEAYYEGVQEEEKEAL